MVPKVSPLVLRSERSSDGVDPRTIRVGKRIRNHAKCVGVTERGPGRFLVKLQNTIEIEGEAKPAMVAEWLFMLVYPS